MTLRTSLLNISVSVSLYVPVGICHVQAHPHLFSVFLRGEGNVAALLRWFIPHIFNDIHFLSFVENLIKF